MLLVAIDDAEPLPAAFDPAAVGQLARHGLAARHGEHSLDAGRVRRIFRFVRRKLPDGE